MRFAFVMAAFVPALLSSASAQALQIVTTCAAGAGGGAGSALKSLGGAFGQ